MSDEQRRSSMRHAGAIEFMAPEQNEGKMLFQTDIYSYGVILYELLAGEVPFPLLDNGETARNTVMISHMESPVPNLLALRRQHLPKKWSQAQQEREMQVPGWLLKTIYRCLEKLPENRYSNGLVLHEAIVADSIAASNDGPADQIIAVLKTENEKLQTQLLQYQQEAINAKSSSVNIPRSIFTGMILLLIVAVTFGGYSALSKKRNTALPVRDSTSKFVPNVLNSKLNSKKANKKALTDTNSNKGKDFSGINFPTNDSVKDSVNKPLKSANNQKKKHQRKRKKFLGIF
jgi:serine/threonine-protein kinase